MTKMGLNTSLLIIKNITDEHVINDIFHLLNFNVIKTHVQVDWRKKATFLYQNQESIAYILINDTLYLECTYNVFSTYSKPLILQELGKRFEIFIVDISDTVDISSYSIFKNGKYFSKTYGLEDWDLSFLEEEEVIETHEQKSSSSLIDDPQLSVHLETFIENFDYDILVDKIFNIVEIENLEDK